jgi:hypothetical protein
MQLSAGPRQHSYTQGSVPRNSWSHFTVSDSRLLEPGGPGPRIYIPQEQGSLVIPPGTGFPFRRLLRLAWLRWWYSTQLPHGWTDWLTNWVAPIVFKITHRHWPLRKHFSFHCLIQLLQLSSNWLHNTVSHSDSVDVEACLPRRWLATAGVSFVSRSLPSNGSICHCICLKFLLSWGLKRNMLVLRALVSMRQWI